MSAAMDWVPPADHLAPVYAQWALDVVDGAGVHLNTRDGRRVLDLYGGHAVAALGYSHPVVFQVPEGIKIEIEKAVKIMVTGADRQLLGQVCAEIRKLRVPDPYKAKGIKYSDEVIRRKVGKAGAK